MTARLLRLTIYVDPEYENKIHNVIGCLDGLDACVLEVHLRTLCIIAEWEAPNKVVFDADQRYRKDSLLTLRPIEMIPGVASVNARLVSELLTQVDKSVPTKKLRSV